MTEIGIVSVHMTKKLKYKFFCGIEISKCTNAYIPYTNAAICISEKRFKKSDKKDLLRLFNRAAKKLEKSGIKRIYKESGLPDETKRSIIPPKMLVRTFRLAMTACETEPPLGELAIRANCDVDLKKLIGDAVMISKRIHLYTDDVYAANSAAEYIFEKYGVIIDVSAKDDFDSAKSKYTIDTVKRCVRTGDLRVDGIVISIESKNEKICLDNLFGENISVDINNEEMLKLLLDTKAGEYEVRISGLCTGGRIIPTGEGISRTSRTSTVE